jgi:hypothetical protein
VLFNILSKEENNILSGLSYIEYNRLRKAVIESILGTDMTKHFTICSSFEQLIKKVKNDGFDKRSLSADEKDVFIDFFILHNIGKSKNRN